MQLAFISKEQSICHFIQQDIHFMAMTWRNWGVFTSISEDSINFFANPRKVLIYLFGKTCIHGLRVFIIPGKKNY